MEVGKLYSSVIDAFKVKLLRWCIKMYENNMSKVLLHIPHSSTYIPENIKEKLLLDKAEIDRELKIMTDLYTDLIFTGADTIKCEFSRLVCDVERFENDEEESMAKVGMGAVYTKTSDGKMLREISKAERKQIIENYYNPYHKKFEILVEEKLNKYGECLIIDCHSFNEKADYVDMKDAPDICIGIDDFHTPENIKEAVVQCFKSFGYEVEVDVPFKGSIVPLKYYGKDKRVKSIMVEVNRRVYLKERIEFDKDRINAITDACNALIDLIHR